MNRKDLARALAKQTKMTQSKAEKLIAAFGDVISDALDQGDKITYSNFGTFYTVHYPSKIIHHPVLGAKKKMVMLPTDTVKWMPSDNIKDIIRIGKEMASATSFGASKQLEEIKRKEGICIKKAIELDEPTAETEVAKAGPEQEDYFEIPIRVTPKESEPEKVQEKVEAKDNNSQEVIKASDQLPEPNDKYKNFWWQFLEEENKATKPALPNLAKDPDDEDIEAYIERLRQSRKSWITPLKERESRSADAQRSGKQAKPAVEDDLQPFFDWRKEIDFVDLSNIKISKDTLRLVPEKIAREFMVIPLYTTPKTITVATDDPQNVEALAIVKKITGKDILPKLASESQINDAFIQYENQEDDEYEIKQAAKIPASRILTAIARRAIRDHATDIHLEPAGEGAILRFRIDGTLQNKTELPTRIYSALLSKLKKLGRLDETVPTISNEGHFNLHVNGSQLACRLSILKVATGERAVLNITGRSARVPKIEELGMSAKEVELIKKACAKSQGLILVSGTNNSEKITTLYSLVEALRPEGISIFTLEDKIESELCAVNQLEISEESAISPLEGLRSILRQDPDVIMISNLRDKETAETAMQTSLTGHLVLASISAADSSTAIARLFDLGVEPFLVSSSLNLVLGQRLVRRICDQCRSAKALSEGEQEIVKKEISLLPQEIKKSISRFSASEGKGCQNCEESGYLGRIGLYEVMEINGEIRDLISQKATPCEIKNAAIKCGMTTLDQDGLLKANSGLTTLEEIQKVAKE